MGTMHQFLGIHSLPFTKIWLLSISIKKLKELSAHFAQAVSDIHTVPSRWNSPCRGEGAYPVRSSNQTASTRRAQLSIAAKVVRQTDLLNNVRT